jgi:hypothetical protein
VARNLLLLCITLPMSRLGALLHANVNATMMGRRVLAASALLAASACGGEPTVPSNPESPKPVVAARIAVGDTVVTILASSDSFVFYTIQPSESVELAIFVQAEQGSFTLGITDSTTGETLGLALAVEDGAPGHLTLSRSDIVQTQANQVLLLRVQALRTGTSGRLRFWVYRISRAPEVLPNGIAIEDTLHGEVLENSADIDEFVFSATVGEEFIAFIQGEHGIIPSGLELQVFSPSGDKVALATNGSGDVELEAQPSGRFVIPATGTYRVAIGQFYATRTTMDFPGTGGFRALIRRIDRTPEHTLDTLAAGDTLGGEAVDFVGDVDEFRVPVTADSIYNVFLQTLASPDPVTIRVRVSSGAGEIGLTSSNAGDSTLAGQFTGNFTATASGTITVQVAGASDGPGLDRGPYRLFVYPVNRAPELAPTSLTAGDSVVESIEYPGDIDAFIVSPPATGVLNLILRRGNARDEWLDFTWTGSMGTGILSCYPRFGETETGCGSGRLTVAGPLRIEIASQFGGTTGFRGTYRLVTLPIDLAPEGRPVQFAIGDIVTEELNPVGDGDGYEFPYSAGDLIELQGTGGSGSSGDGFLISVGGPAGGFAPGYAEYLPASTGWFKFLTTGSCRVSVRGASLGREVTERGPYTFSIRRVSSAAEIVSSPLAIGDSVSGETIGQIGDVDDFTLAGPAGAEVQVFLRGAMRLTVDGVVVGTSTLIRAGALYASGRLTLPAGGQIGLRVYEPRTYSGALHESGLSFTGPYSIAVHQIDRAPETIGSALTLGTTANGEAIDFEGDVDEFTFPGNAGQRVTATLSAPFSFDGAYVRLDIVDSSNGQVLGTATANDATQVSTGSVLLPAAGTYRLIVYGVDDTRGKGGYRLVVQ